MVPKARGAHRRRPLIQPRYTRPSYYQTPRWHEQRLACLKRDRHTCRACGYRNPSGLHLQAHHTNNEVYGRLGRERRRDLMTLCEPCHLEITVLHKSGRMTIAAATRWFVKARREQRRQSRWGRTSVTGTSLYPTQNRRSERADYR